MPPLARHACRIGVAALALTATLASVGCRNRKNVAQHLMRDPASGLAGQRCGGAGQIVRPLIIEWPATDRASLEGRLRRGLVVVRYDSCVVEVLRECTAPEGAYDYLGITRKNDQLKIQTADELYANMPLTALELESKLATSGQLDVEMAIVGNYEAARARFDISELEGRCTGATHVIAAAQVGAFEFYSGAAAEVSASVEVEQVAGVGGSSSASRELLAKDGDPVSCEVSTPDDTTPPAECGALLRLELTALDGVAATCPPGAVWNGSACVTPERQQTEAKQERDAKKAEKKAENEVVARQLCELQMQCEAEAQGILPPEGDGLERQLGVCTNMTKIMINDYTRPQARQCVSEGQAGGCQAYEACAAKLQPDFDDEEPSADADFDAGFDEPSGEDW